MWVSLDVLPSPPLPLSQQGCWGGRELGLFPSPQPCHALPGLRQADGHSPSGRQTPMASSSGLPGSVHPVCPMDTGSLAPGVTPDLGTGLQAVPSSRSLHIHIASGSHAPRHGTMQLVSLEVVHMVPMAHGNPGRRWSQGEGCWGAEGQCWLQYRGRWV